jgi:DNA modification methylase
MEEFGDLSGIVLNLRSRHLVGGHQRLKNLDPAWKITKTTQHDKTGTVAVGYIRTPFGLFTYREVDWPESKELAANLAANKISGEWDNVKLAPILEDLMKTPDLFKVTGFSLQEANLIIEGIEQELEGNPADDKAPPRPAKSQTKPGQLWKLGSHRLLCGDATDPNAWKKLMDGKKAALCITDPPYGVEYNVHGKHQFNPITKKRTPNRWRENISGDVDTGVAVKALPLIFENMIDESVLYATCGTDLAVDMINWLRTAKIHYGTLMVWNKGFTVVSWLRYHAQHESIVYAGKGTRPGKYVRWFAGKQETTVWDIPIDARGERIHPTQKPVALYERAMVNSSAPNEICVDPFAGSGTMIIAAEKHKRHAYLIEKDSAYCDVIVKRYMAYTTATAKP